MPIAVAVLAFEHISPFHLTVPCVVFGDAHPGFELKVCTPDAAPVSTTAGFTISTRHGLEALDDAQIVVLPSWHDPATLPQPEILHALQAAHARGAQLVGLCLGAYVLAATGLLAGRRATTHWAYAADFARRYPDIHLDPQVLYVEEGNLLTSAGTAAGLDCCLHIVRQHFGAESANTVARYLVIPPHRQGGQAQYIDQPVLSTPRDARLGALLDWVRARLGETHTLDSLAEKALMSRRTLTRRFRQITGGTVLEWLLRERLALVQRLLESTDQPVEAIASLAGFGSPSALRQHFRAAFGVPPQQWRRAFRGESV